jgi:hypothetical protein
MVPEGEAGATAAGAAAGLGDWLFNIVPKSVAGVEVREVAGVSDLRRIAGAVYVGSAAVLNVGLKCCM